MHVFWDIGGVLLTNGWDRRSRAAAARRFGFDHADFEARHGRVVEAFDCGRMDLDQYLVETLFFHAQPFTKEAVREFIYAQSQPFDAVLRVAEAFASNPDCFMAALNNESLPLNHYRIETFGLRRYFRCFFSSCYLGARKPSPKIYALALQLTQAPPEQCVFIDDRPENLEPARQLHMRTIHYTDAEQLHADLAAIVSSLRA